MGIVKISFLIVVTGYFIVNFVVHLSPVTPYENLYPIIQVLREAKGINLLILSRRKYENHLYFLLEGHLPDKRYENNFLIVECEKCKYKILSEEDSSTFPKEVIGKSTFYLRDKASKMNNYRSETEFHKMLEKICKEEITTNDFTLQICQYKK